MVCKARKSDLFIFILMLLSGLTMAACDGSAVIGINYDATQGVGNIVVVGEQGESETGVVQTQSANNVEMSQVLLFGLVIALLFGTVAIVIALSRRPRT